MLKNKNTCKVEKIYNDPYIEKLSKRYYLFVKISYACRLKRDFASTVFKLYVYSYTTF